MASCVNVILELGGMYYMRKEHYR